MADRQPHGAAGSRDEPICLLDDSSSDGHSLDADGGGAAAAAAATRKRPAPPASSSNGSNTNNADIGNRFTPFRLYTTSNDIRADRTTTRGRSQFCSTLREMIGLDATCTRSHSPPGSTELGPMKWIVIINYLLDFDWLLDEIPELLSLDRALVFYGSPLNELGPLSWQRATSSTADFIRLVPSDPRSTKYNPLPFKMDWGVHHTKMFLVGYENRLRVVIHTSNLRRCDFDDNTQGAYVQDFPLKEKFSTETAGSEGVVLRQDVLTWQHGESEDVYLTSSSFEEDLIQYLHTYRQTKKYLWPLEDGAAAATTERIPLLLTQVLRRYEYSSAYGVLVPSVPGYHRLNNCPFGHLKLRDAIRKHTPANRRGGTIICQYSSIGSFSLKWLHEFASSMDVQAVRSSQQPLARGATSSTLLDKVKIVWPTMEEVRTAAAGYASGGPIPGRMKNVDKPFLARFYHRWSTVTDYLKKRSHPGHIKTFLQLSPDEKEVEWCLLTSHNLSTAALGQIQNNSSMGERVLFTRHWELGVLVTPDTLRNANVVEERTSTSRKGEVPTRARGGVTGEGEEGQQEQQHRIKMVPYQGVDKEYGPNDVILPLPFDTTPTRYGSQDIPWAVDRKGSLPDAYGRILG